MEEKRYHSQEGRPSVRGWLITGNYTFRLVTACVLSYCDSTCCNDPHLSLSLYRIMIKYQRKTRH